MNPIVVCRHDHEGWQLKGGIEKLVVLSPKLRVNDDVDAERQPCVAELCCITGHRCGVHDGDGKALQAKDLRAVSMQWLVQIVVAQMPRPGDEPSQSSNGPCQEVEVVQP